MKILLTGATGFVGTRLVEKLLEAGHELNILSRGNHHYANPNVKVFSWPDSSQRPPLESISGIDGVINLMGESIAAKRWSDEQKAKLRSSRVDSTLNLSALINENRKEPLSFFISSSAVGIYPVNNGETMDENAKTGKGFLPELCHAWEEAAQTVKNCKRVVTIRTAVVLEAHGGALQKMLPPFKLGLGGPIGDGNHIMSWIHLDDLVAIFLKAVNDETMNGVYNGSAPAPVDNFHFTKALGEALHRPTLFPVPAAALKLAFGEMSTIVLDSQSVVSKRLTEAGFQFSYPTIESAFAKIFGKK